MRDDDEPDAVQHRGERAGALRRRVARSGAPRGARRDRARTRRRAARTGRAAASVRSRARRGRNRRRSPRRRGSRARARRGDDASERGPAARPLGLVFDRRGGGLVLRRRVVVVDGGRRRAGRVGDVVAQSCDVRPRTSRSDPRVEFVRT